MSHFYGYLEGNKGVATRCGSRGSGISAHIRSWNNDVYANLEEVNDEDCLTISFPKGMKHQINGLTLEPELFDFLCEAEHREMVKELIVKSKILEALPVKVIRL